MNTATRAAPALRRTLREMRKGRVIRETAWSDGTRYARLTGTGQRRVTVPGPVLRGLLDRGFVRRVKGSERRVGPGAEERRYEITSAGEEAAQ